MPLGHELAGIIERVGGGVDCSARAGDKVVDSEQYSLWEPAPPV